MTITTTTLDAADNNFVLGETLRPLLTHAMGSAVEVFDTSGPAEAGPPPHRHPWEEIYVVLSGQLEVTVDGSARIIGPGGAAHVPPIRVQLPRRRTSPDRRARLPRAQRRPSDPREFRAPSSMEHARQSGPEAWPARVRVRRRPAAPALAARRPQRSLTVTPDRRSDPEAIRARSHRSSPGHRRSQQVLRLSGRRLWPCTTAGLPSTQPGVSPHHRQHPHLRPSHRRHGHLTQCHRSVADLDAFQAAAGRATSRPTWHRSRTPTCWTCAWSSSPTSSALGGYGSSGRT